MNRVTVVLNRPIYPRNVGMCARAMANLGATRLVVIAPQTPLNDEAKQGAAHAQDVLRNAAHYHSLTEFLNHEGEGIRIALSGKDARLKSPDDLETKLAQMTADAEHPVHDSRRAIYLMFGTEDDGLSAEELEVCHHVCRLPTYTEVSSFNLSHAVLLTLFIVRRGLVRENDDILSEVAPPAIEPAFFPRATIRTWLETLGFDLSSPRITIEKTFNRILLSQTPTRDELRLLETVLQQTIRKLKNRTLDQ